MMILYDDIEHLFFFFLEQRINQLINYIFL
jgi:hypothetical protein